MANYYVDSAAGGTASGADWTNAYLTLLAATAVATSADTIYVDDGHSETVAAATTWTFPTTVGLRLFSVDKALGLTPATVSAGAAVYGGAGTWALALNGCVYNYGVSFYGSTGASASSDLLFGQSVSGPQIQTHESCTLHSRGNSTTAQLVFGTASNNYDESHITLLNCSWGVGNVNSSVVIACTRVTFVDSTLIGTASTDLFALGAGSQAQIDLTGCDLSGVAYTNMVESATGNQGCVVRLNRCRLMASTVNLLSGHTTPGGTEVFLHDCSSGDTHGIFAYANSQGSIITDSTIKFTGGAAALSWKITTTAYASFLFPFKTPWVHLYNSTLSAVSPRIEVVRTGNTTALNDDEVWIEVDAKVTSTSTKSTRSSDRRGLLAAAASQATGAGTWDGSPATPWYGKLEVASLTPAEVGHISARVCVGAASIAGTLYADPQIRT